METVDVKGVLSMISQRERLILGSLAIVATRASMKDQHLSSTLR